MCIRCVHNITDAHKNASNFSGQLSDTSLEHHPEIGDDSSLIGVVLGNLSNQDIGIYSNYCL